MAKVVFEEPDRHGPQRLGRRRYLRQDVDAVLVLLDHPLQAPDLALDPAQSLEVTVLLLYVARCRAARSRVHSTLTGLPLPGIPGSIHNTPGWYVTRSQPPGGGLAWSLQFQVTDPEGRVDHSPASTALAKNARTALQPPPLLMESRMASPPTSRWSKRCSSSTVV